MWDKQTCVKQLKQRQEELKLLSRNQMWDEQTCVKHLKRGTNRHV